MTYSYKPQSVSKSCWYQPTFIKTFNKTHEFAWFQRIGPVAYIVIYTKIYCVTLTKCCESHISKECFGGLVDLEFENSSLKKDERTKTSERYVFEAESKVSQSRIGTLEDVRFRLGLSRRKMCQLLLVDPSAWTRWNRKGADAPPHIYRCLLYTSPSPRD